MCRSINRIHPHTQKPEVETEIQDGGGGHLDFLKTQYLIQLLTDFDAVKNTRLEISCAIKKRETGSAPKIQDGRRRHLVFT